ncbi:MAG TPA: metal ABC transporter substrate-binding protein [Actinomycetota bacterium]|nr:metal ABC transporter substrate-binding protein [Actinomycetota bacterium]
MEVVASFYPLAFAAERAGGEGVSVRNLTPPGVEPHDLELTPDDLEAIAEADVVVYLGGGFQSVVEDAVEAEATGITVDVFEGIDPLRAPSGDEGDNGSADPHVWLDPVLYSGIAARVATEIGEVEARDGARVAANAGDLDEDLMTLDAEFRRGLARCDTRVMITNHAAFGYLAAAYGLEQHAISGLSPESEPNPQRIAELAAEARAEGVTTVFTEDLVAPEVAETLAAEAGLDTAVLSPLEGLTDEQEAAGDDYLSVMRRNLEVLRDGLVCA